LRCADLRRARRRAHLCGAALLAVAALLASCTSASDPEAAPTPTIPAPVATTPTLPPTSTPSPSPTTSPTTTSSPAAPSVAAFENQQLRWRACGDGFQCARLRVPLDYARPSASATFRLPLVRLKAGGPGRRLGALVVNPGGPGGSGVRYARAARFAITPAVRARYDIVGFDPRGVQGSDPNIQCLTDRQFDRFVKAETSEDNAAQQARLARLFAAQCRARSPELLPFVGTRDAARDLDVLRAALGEPRLDFLGKSYGTLLGITYADAFPSRVGRFVLDGVVDPALDPDGVLRGQSEGFDVAYRAFLRNCVRGGCPLGDSVGAAYARTVRELDALDEDPLPAGGGRVLNGALARLALLGSLYEDRTQWGVLRAAWADLLDGSPAAMLAVADATVDRSPDGSYPDNSNAAQYSVTCVDRDYVATVPDVIARARSLAVVSPVFGEYLAWGDLPCSSWAVPNTRDAAPVQNPAIPPVLVLGTTRDPATPYAWSASLADQLGDASLVRWRGDGHTAYARGNACVNAAVEDFLLRGDRPTGVRTCVGR
jgi:pimeloyl-ACP methyl ester carboxylesterase